MACSAKQRRREANQLFRLCLVDGHFDASRAREVVKRILQARRRGYLGLLKQFRRLLKLYLDRHTAQVESVIPLPVKFRVRVQSRLEAVYGTGISIQFAQNPTLIAGMRIKVGCDVYDGSVQHGLAVLAKSFGITSPNGRNAVT